MYRKALQCVHTSQENRVTPEHECNKPGWAKRAMPPCVHVFSVRYAALRCLHKRTTVQPRAMHGNAPFLGL